MLTVARALTLLGVAGAASAIGLQSCVSTSSQGSSSFPIVVDGKAAPVLIDAKDFPGVQRAAADFAADIKRVSGHSPTLRNSTSTAAAKDAGKTAPIIIGTLGQSALLDAVISNAKVDTSAVKGKWEAYHSAWVKNPLPGVDSAYVIIGSDKRGTIYALYDHSEQMGVSPWYWWADVPVKTSKFIYASGCSHGSPTVKYRGFFLNDEQPALQSWAQEKFTNSSTAAPFNHFFYSHIFELMLRLRGNMIWPAMWSGMFGVDDKDNQPLADWYGVIMGTSHQEPMARSSPNEWNIFWDTYPSNNGSDYSYSTNGPALRDYWRDGVKRAAPYETLYTIGMRGAGDVPLGPSVNIPLLEGIISDQRAIFKDILGTDDGSKVPQVWCLYKEVQGYYEGGMQVPDDVLLLWADDNWGNLRRIPMANERNRTGGSGIYYHIDYVGDPRDYKWLQSTPIEKTYEQMSYALETGADRLWVLNVGDMKPNEMHIEFFFQLGYDASNFNPDSLAAYRTKWATREFGLTGAKAQAVGDAIGSLDKWNMNRKPELVNATVYSLTNYREAERVLQGYKNLTEIVGPIYDALPSGTKPAFFQLVQHPIQASYTLMNMWISAGMNNLRASQAKLSANTYGQTVEDMFERDYDLEHEYHTMLDGKWDHMMDQTHVMYYYWQQPMTNTMPMITKVQSRKQALAGAMRLTIEGNPGAWPGDNPNQCAQGYSCPPPTLSFDSYLPTGNRYFEIGAGGPAKFTYVAAANVTWLKFDTPKGSISPSKPEQRVYTSVDWSKLSVGTQYAAIQLNATIPGQPAQSFTFYATATKNNAPADFKGFVEGDGGVSIEAAHASRNTSVGDVAWTVLPNIGRTADGVTPWPRMGNDGKNYTAGTGPHLEYDIYTFNTGPNSTVHVTAYLSPSLNSNGVNRPIAFALQMDDSAPTTSYFIPAAVPGSLPAAWGGNDGFVANNAVAVTVNATAAPGKHTLKLWMIEPAVVVHKLVVNTGGVMPSYLGPPESVRV